jgi:hypothetical protein
MIPFFVSCFIFCEDDFLQKKSKLELFSMGKDALDEKAKVR